MRTRQAAPIAEIILGVTEIRVQITLGVTKTGVQIILRVTQIGHGRPHPSICPHELVCQLAENQDEYSTTYLL